MAGVTKQQPPKLGDVEFEPAAGRWNVRRAGELVAEGVTLQQMLGVIRRRRMIVNIPFPVASAMGLAFDTLNFVSFGLIPAQITRDQVRNLRRDNVVGEGVKTFADLGLRPASLEAILPEYLWRFRPSGQYDAIKESAGNQRV